MKDDKIIDGGISKLSIEDSVEKQIHQKEENDGGVCIILDLENEDPPTFDYHRSE